MPMPPMEQYFSCDGFIFRTNQADPNTNKKQNQKCTACNIAKIDSQKGTVNIKSTKDNDKSKRKDGRQI